MPIEDRFRTDQFLSQLSTFGIGGRIRYYLAAVSTSDLQEGMNWAIQQKMPYFILGRGSNCLFDDQGYDGLVIHNRVEFCEYHQQEVYVGAGYPFSRLGRETAMKGLSGLEFAGGIPGSLGGAIFMNAGSNQCEISHSIQEVHFSTELGEERILLPKDLAFGYRYSSLQAMLGSIIAARFLLTPNPQARALQLSMLRARERSQPIQVKSAGCVFRNPNNEQSAGRLIEACELKGFSIGGAKVSPVHANFIVNENQATAQDVLSLISHIQSCVNERFGILLKPEIRVVFFR